MIHKKKLKVAVLFGGKSAEHEISLQSAKNVIQALDKRRFEPVLIGIDKEGVWHLGEGGRLLLTGGDSPLKVFRGTSRELMLRPGAQKNQIMKAGSPREVGNIDVVFPVLHGPFGEDGSIQGMLKLANLPFVGSGVLGSAAGMDKEVTKRLLREAGIPVADFLCFSGYQRKSAAFGTIVQKVGLPFFIKPANLGSSVGISKVNQRKDFSKAMEEAFQYDRKIIIEENIKGREIECAVLGNEHPVASLPGEILSNNAKHGFYSYEAKYLDEKGAVLAIPAKLPKNTVKRIQEMAVKAFQALCCEGMARVDFFLKEDGTLLVNELNTIPGFTAISMYPKLWEASGIPYTRLISNLIDLAIQRFQEEQSLKTTVE